MRIYANRLARTEYARVNNFESMFKSHLICATHYHTSINLLMPPKCLLVHSMHYSRFLAHQPPQIHMTRQVIGKVFFFSFRTQTHFTGEQEIEMHAHAMASTSVNIYITRIWHNIQINGNFRANDKDLNLINRQKVVYNIFIKTNTTR